MAETLTMPAPYEATYEIIRGGKATATQTTTFNQKDNNHYSLIDQTKGTHGLASFSGFKRNETTDFSLVNNTISYIQHKMHQKVALSNKRYHFKAENNRIKGKHKKNFEIITNTKPLSAHLLPVWLSAVVCQGQKNITLEVLKDNKTKTYNFTVDDANAEYFRVDRQYPAESVKSTSIWLDKNNECFPTRTLHQKKGDPPIETKLTNLVYKSLTN